MNAGQLKQIIERAKASVNANKHDSTYQEVMQGKIDQLIYKVCLDQEIASLCHISDDQELASHLDKLADELEQSI